MAFVDISGPIVSDTVYVENELVAKDVSITLPEVAAVTTDIMAMGNLSLPIWQMLEDMEISINKIGVDMGLSKMIKPQPLGFEMRWVQIVVDANAMTRNVPCKAFVRCIPKVIPGAEITIGESTENEVLATVMRYTVVVDGEILWRIDRLAGVLEVDGVDYSQDISSFL